MLTPSHPQRRRDGLHPVLMGLHRVICLSWERNRPPGGQWPTTNKISSESAWTVTLARVATLRGTPARQRGRPFRQIDPWVLRPVRLVSDSVARAAGRAQRCCDCPLWLHRLSVLWRTRARAQGPERTALVCSDNCVCRPMRCPAARNARVYWHLRRQLQGRKGMPRARGPQLPCRGRAGDCPEGSACVGREGKSALGLGEVLVSLSEALSEARGAAKGA